MKVDYEEFYYKNRFGKPQKRKGKYRRAQKRKWGAILVLFCIAVFCAVTYAVLFGWELKLKKDDVVYILGVECDTTEMAECISKVFRSNGESGYLITDEKTLVVESVSFDAEPIGAKGTTVIKWTIPEVGLDIEGECYALTLAQTLEDMADRLAREEIDYTVVWSRIREIVPKVEELRSSVSDITNVRDSMTVAELNRVIDTLRSVESDCTSLRYLAVDILKGYVDLLSDYFDPTLSKNEDINLLGLSVVGSSKR